MTDEIWSRWKEVRVYKQNNTKMKILLFLILIFSFAFFSCSNKNNSQIDYVKYVNPFIGTSSNNHTFPGATVPFGFVQLSPNTGNYTYDYHSGYQFNDSTLRGFAHTHLSGGALPILGDVLMFPFSNDEALKNGYIKVSKKKEIAYPGYYSTFLTEDKIKVELSTTQRTGIHRYTFQEGGSFHVLINLDEVLGWEKFGDSFVKDAYFKVENDTVISGYQRIEYWHTNRKVFFSILLSKPFNSYHFTDGETKRKLIIDYGVAANKTVEARVAISTVSIDGAKKNLTAESVGSSFEKIVSNASTEWNKYLSRVHIKGTEKQKEIFYTGLYHLFIQPNIISDVDGKYRGADDKVHDAPSGGMYSTFALWDIYRAAFPLYTILIPEKISPFVNSILQHYDQKGYLPTWPLWGQDRSSMIGNHSVPVIVDAILKDFKGIDKAKAFDAIKATLTKNFWWKYDWSLYDKYGYLPADTVTFESVSRTLEATFDDWCAAQLVNNLGKSEDYAFFTKRSGYYKNLYDTTTMFMRGRNMDGSWGNPFNPLMITDPGGVGNYTEGNAWHYLFHVQHDVDELIKLMGGKDRFETRLDSLFTMDSKKIGYGWMRAVTGMIGQYAHGNEHSHHVIYLYNYAGKPEKTRAYVRKVLETFYDNTVDGLCGNDDFGQMSAWYVLSALGFYPVNPVSGAFDIGVPLYEEATIYLPNNKEFIVKSSFPVVAPPEDLSVFINGKKINDYKFQYSDIMKGGELLFTK